MSNNSSTSDSDNTNEKITCAECGGRYARNKKVEHLNTKIHKQYEIQRIVVDKMMRQLISEIVNNVLANI